MTTREVRVEWELVTDDEALRPHERETLDVMVAKLLEVSAGAVNVFGWQGEALAGGGGVARVGELFVGVVMRVGELTPSASSVTRIMSAGDVEREASFVWVYGRLR